MAKQNCGEIAILKMAYDVVVKQYDSGMVGVDWDECIYCKAKKIARHK